MSRGGGAGVEGTGSCELLESIKGLLQLAKGQCTLEKMSGAVLPELKVQSTATAHRKLHRYASMNMKLYFTHEFHVIVSTSFSEFIRFLFICV